MFILPHLKGLTAGNIGSAAFKNARLDLKFATNKSLIDSISGNNLVSFTRASSGTYVGSDGLIKTAVTNLLLRSEEFDNASWTKQSSVSVSANTTISPDGALTADTVTADQSLGIFQSVAATVSTTYTNSVYVKAGTATAMMLRDDTGAGRHIVFNPSTGVITATSGTLVSSGSQALNNGWYRYFMTYVADATTVRGIIRPNSAGSAQTFIAWGAQIEQASALGDYVPTVAAINSAPRFDHKPTTGESLGLLVEEARTNLLLQSNQFDTTWTNSNSSDTAAAGTAPDGTNTAWELKDTLDASPTAHTIQQSVSFTSGITYSLSLWMKAGTVAEGGIALPSAAFGAVLINRINLSTGAVISSSGSTTTVVTPFPAGWYRITLTATATATASGNVQIRPMNGGTTYTGTGNGTILIWAAQIEAGAFPTSYIPTTSATVTRAADVASITGANFSSFYNQTEGTVFAEANVLSSSYSTGVLWDLGAGGAFGSTEYIGWIGTGWQLGPNTAPINVASSVSATLPSKTAAAIKLNNSIISASGLLGALDTSCTVPTSASAFTIGKGGWSGASNHVNGTIKRLTYWPTRLANTVLQQITL
jgi:hypothetical protein